MKNFPVIVLSTFLATIALASVDANAQVPPFNGGGAGAFDPEISIINSGALLDAQVVVSEDRRYVTITARPSVSRIQALDVFPVAGFTGGGGGVAGGGGARMGFVGGAGFIDDNQNAPPAEVQKPAESKESAERKAHANQQPANTSQTPSASSATEALKTDVTAANSVLRKEGMFLLTPAKSVAKTVSK